MWTVKNMHITLSEDVARWLWIKAAEDNKTVSEWVSELLEEARRRQHDYRIAMQMLLTGTPDRIDWPSETQVHAGRVVRPPGEEARVTR